MYQHVIRDPGGDSVVRIVSGLQPVNGSLLLVPADTMAFVVLNGEVSEPILPGRPFALHTGTSPFFVRLRNLMTRGDPGIAFSVFYVSCHRQSLMQMGTGDVLFTENRFRLSMKAMAAVSFFYRIARPRVFLQQLVGMYTDSFCQEDLEPAMRALVLPDVRETLSHYLASGSPTRFQNETTDLGSRLQDRLRPTFAAFGLEISRLRITVNLPQSELEQLRSLEKEEAGSRVRTDAEVYHLQQVYGSLENRTMTEVLTGMPRTPFTNGALPPPQGGAMGGMAGMMASMPLQLAFLQQMTAAMREPMEEMSRQSSLFSQTQTNEEPAQNAAPDLPPPLPANQVCRRCGGTVPLQAARCPICGHQL